VRISAAGDCFRAENLWQRQPAKGQPPDPQKAAPCKSVAKRVTMTLAEDRQHFRLLNKQANRI
jgi:hypothetical protein